MTLATNTTPRKPRPGNKPIPRKVEQRAIKTVTIDRAANLFTVQQVTRLSEVKQLQMMLECYERQGFVIVEKK